MAEKDLFREFINSLESINHLSDNIPIRNVNVEYVERLINEYGLPQDEAFKQALISIREHAVYITKVRFMPQLLKQYILVMLWDLSVKSEQPMDTVYGAFLLGMAAGELIEWEEIEDPPED